MPGKAIIAHHLIWTLYGHWLPNDPRGSGSERLRDEKFATLGEIHHGRKPEHLQPSRGELRTFQRTAEPLLTHERFWLRERHRAALAKSLAECVARHKYTVWACAILANHMHLVVRRHRDHGGTIWQRIAERSRIDLQQLADVADGHPVWSDRPYDVFLHTAADIRRCARYVEQNPVKERLAPQQYAFVVEYDGWPFGKR